MNNTPVIYTWDGEAMAPLSRFRALCDRQFVVGENYRMIIHEERSSATHKHYFACIRDAWYNLPDALAVEFATPEALRKRALISAGYYNERRFIASTPAEARKIAKFLKPRDEDHFAAISVSGCAVIERTAKSQSHKAMGKKQFAESKQAVLEILEEMIGAKLPQEEAA